MFAQRLGALGLFIVSLLDSSVLPLPEVNDVLLVFMVANHEQRMILYAAMATLGSLAGCFIIYFIGAKGGDALLRKRSKGKLAARATQLFERYGVMAILVPAILPPPAPFKLFILMAGSARMSKPRFTLALLAGRGFRFFGIGILSVYYGDAAIQFIRENGRVVSAVVGLAVLGGGIAYMLYRRRAAKKMEAGA